MSAMVNINNVEIEVLEHQDTWAVSNKEVALAFGVVEETIRQQKSRGEYKDGVHFYTVTNSNGGADKTMWTKKGVITLGFKLRETPQTIAFRDWASDYIIKTQDAIVPQLPQNYKEALLELVKKVEEIEILDRQIQEQKPLVSFAKTIEASVDSVLIGTYAKLLSDSEGLRIGQNKLYDWLRDNSYLINGGARHNVPYQKYIDNGYFEVTTSTFAGSTGAHQRFTTKITGKGQIALAQKIVASFKREVA